MQISKLFRQTIVPLFLIVVCPGSVMLIWYTNTNLHGSLFALWDFFERNGFWHGIYQIWAPVFWGSKTAWSMIGIFAALQLILMRIVPGKKAYGPVTPMGNTPVYKANGVSCFLISVFLFIFCAHPLHLYKLSIIYDNFGAILGALNIFSLFFCLFLYLKGLIQPSTSDHGSSGNPLFDYYWGTELYPRILGWDIKMFTNCRFGMMSWGIILISYAAAQANQYTLSNAMIVAVAIQLVYITKFFIWEMGYMRSLDIMHDRAGFYICWGCLVWVPGFYTSATQYLVNHPQHLATWAAIAILILGIGSVLINYFADRQRQVLRASHGNCKIWGQEPNLIHAKYTTEDGELKENILLASGWWGVARHFHYVPEVLGAFFWSLPALFYNVLPYFYAIFLAILLTHRAFRDEKRCSKKYGKYWEEYCDQVPSLILPGMHWRRTQVYELKNEN